MTAPAAWRSKSMGSLAMSAPRKNANGGSTSLSVTAWTHRSETVHLGGRSVTSSRSAIRPVHRKRNGRPDFGRRAAISYGGGGHALLERNHYSSAADRHGAAGRYGAANRRGSQPTQYPGHRPDGLWVPLSKGGPREIRSHVEAGPPGGAYRGGKQGAETVAARPAPTS